MTISLAGFHLGTMADAAIYFIRHDEAQLQSTWGRLAKQGQKAPATTFVLKLSLRILTSYERTQLKIELFPTPPWHFDRL